MKDKKLYLIPVGLTTEDSGGWSGAHLRNVVLPLRRFVVEHPKSARQFLKALGLPLQELEFEILDEHSKAADLERLGRWLESGDDVGLLSEAGCPGIADPGAALVSHAHHIGMQVVPLVGPSSIVLALMASGLNGQRFNFNGYLPQAAAERDARIRELEERSRRLDQTEIFIEAPYRNDQLFKGLVATCQSGTMLCVATDLTTSSEDIRTKPIGEWQRTPSPQLHKRPTVFLLLADKARSPNRRARTADAH
jgi:16S rRNA (cytidine1402-2'-O)-methyltransferase